MELGARAYQPPKGVVGTPPSDLLARDDALIGSGEQIASWMANGVSLGYLEDGLGFMGYPQLAQMAQRAEFRKPCEVIAKEATREWIRFRSKRQGNDPVENDRASKRIAEIEAEFRRLNVRSVVRTQIEHGLKFGLGHVWIGMKGVALDSAAQSVPMKATERGISKGSVERLVNVEPVWTTPNQYAADNVLRPNYYRPDNWWVLGVLVDRSRLITTVPFPVSDILKPAFNFGGQSLTQLLQAYVHNYLGTRNATATIVRNFSKLVLKTDMTGNMQSSHGLPAGQPLPFGDIQSGSIEGRAAMMQDVSNGQGAIVVDKEREDASIIATPLSGLDALQAQSMEAMASIPGIPLVKLFGIQPTGLNASSEGEIRVFYDEIAAFQEAHVSPGLRRIFDLAQINIWGKIDPDLDFEFVHLWQMDEKQAAEIEKIKADTDAVLVQAGIAAPDEARERQATDESSIYRNVDLTGPPPEPPNPEEDGAGLEGLLKRGEESDD